MKRFEIVAFPMCACLVHAQLVDHDEAGASKFDHLYRMVDGAGVFRVVRKLRDEKQADIVGLMLEDPRGCSLSTCVGGSAIDLDCARSRPHPGRTPRPLHRKNDRPFPYGNGYVNGKKWRDIMSYNQACNGCPCIHFWSNPRVMYEGEPTGTKSEDNARVILEQAERASKFR